MGQVDLEWIGGLTDREWSMIRSALNLAVVEWRNRADDNLVDYNDLPEWKKELGVDKQHEALRDTYYKLSAEYKQLWERLRED